MSKVTKLLRQEFGLVSPLLVMPSADKCFSSTNNFSYLIYSLVKENTNEGGKTGIWITLQFSFMSLIHTTESLRLCIFAATCFMIVIQNLQRISDELKKYNATLVAVSKTKTVSEILEVYHAGQKIFGENKVQELCEKYEQLPKDIEWHLIGHLQTNKVKFIAPFVSLIHSVDSMKLLKEINKQGGKNNRIISCLLQIHIAREETKSGLSFNEAEQILHSGEVKQMKNVTIVGLMGMATNTPDKNVVKEEFKKLYSFFSTFSIQHSTFSILSMGMSSDHPIALEEGSNMVRVGSLIFGERNNQ